MYAHRCLAIVWRRLPNLPMQLQAPKIGFLVNDLSAFVDEETHHDGFQSEWSWQAGT